MRHKREGQLLHGNALFPTESGCYGRQGFSLISKDVCLVFDVELMDEM